jgi:nickel/cobalt transporter (NicO) family protein
MDWFIDIQRWLYTGMAEGMRSATPTLIASAFLFGIVHAFMPGHGKSVLVSYHLGRPGRFVDGFYTGALLALTHVGTAIVLVLAGVAVISRSVAVGGRAPAFGKASAVMIALIGASLLVRTLWRRHHQHAQEGKALAVVTGLVPCPLTTFILAYALARGKLALGLVAVGAMLLGIMVTLIAFAVTAVAARTQLMNMLERTQRVGWWLEFAGAAAVLGLGISMLATR